MTTDITELAQRVKTEASTIDDTQWYLAKPSEIRSLVEALESKERIIQVLESSYNEQTEALEKAQETIAFQQGEIKALLSSLESRTVKLPEGDERDDLVISITEEIAHLQRCVERYRKEGMASTTQVMEQRLLVQQIALSVLNSAAGIKWEAE